MNETLLTAFIAITAIAVVIQMGILIGIFLAVKKSTEKMEQIATQVETRALPMLDSAKAILEDAQPKLQEITSNLVDTSTTMKSQMSRIDAALGDLVDRTRLQTIRVDEMVSRTLDKVEETTDMVQHTVIGPVKQINAMMQGLGVGIGTLLQRRRAAKAEQSDRQRATDDEELFI